MILFNLQIIYKTLGPVQCVSYLMKNAIKSKSGDRKQWSLEFPARFFLMTLLLEVVDNFPIPFISNIILFIW